MRSCLLVSVSTFLNLRLQAWFIRVIYICILLVYNILSINTTLRLLLFPCDCAVRMPGNYKVVWKPKGVLDRCKPLHCRILSIYVQVEWVSSHMENNDHLLFIREAAIN
jgi:hypothetical protein